MSKAILAVLAAATALLLAGPGPSLAQKKGACPANPRVASHAIWPVGTLTAGKTVRAMHPCGKYLTCTSGGRAMGSRSCSWG